jgi:anti-sigma B factor antagonist
MSLKHGSPWLEREDFGDVTVVRLKVPRLDDDVTTRDLFHQIDSLIQEAGRRYLVLNLAVPAYLPSLAIGKLILLNRRAQAVHGRLVLCNLSREAAEVLDATHLTELFRIYGTEADAVQSFALTS